MLKLNSLYPELQRLFVNKCTKLDKFVLRNVNKKYFTMIYKIQIDYKCIKFANGYLSLLKWARENKCPWDEDTCTAAAKIGHLEILKWLRANKCPWGKNTCMRAAYNGHLEVLKWLRANGCPWDSYTSIYAVHAGHVDILKWAYQNGCECPMYLIKKYNLDSL